MPIHNPVSKISQLELDDVNAANKLPKLDANAFLILSQVVGNVPGLDASGNVVASGSGHIGSSNFAGPGGVTVTHNLNLANYLPYIIATADGNGAIGEVWITDVAVNTFVLRNSGSAVTTFSWVIFEIS